MDEDILVAGAEGSRIRILLLSIFLPPSMPRPQQKGTEDGTNTVLIFKGRKWHHCFSLQSQTNVILTQTIYCCF